MKDIVQKLAKLFTKADECTSRKKARKIIKKATKLQKSIDA